ncbi:hypothetical protein H9I45_04605 [Polaribacter haliotis]|uniref:Uncharacterized protein n=1 Tax=Polaribacter haliotis TaxID=1888915 RepID=A0A7L8AI98_9FLAO|nr:hypothetical protein [Polaribacter haliotis]QOD61735.1 hypothetical protein H9I45_04605 [Polaribacter haliotis]
MKALGYIFIFYIGFYFYRLAENHKKNKWLFGFLGIAIYFLSLLIYPLYLRFFNVEDIDEYSLTLVSFKSFAIGFICILISFQLLNFFWNRKKKTNKKEIEKIGK